MKQFIKDYFTFNRKERNGILVLLTIILSLIIYINISEYFIVKQKVDFSEFEKEIDEFLIARKRNNNKNTLYSHAQNKNEQWSDIELFYFDPNNLSTAEWEKLGFKDWQIKAIINYKSKAGRFNNKEDFKKLRVISEEQYQLIEPYISIPEQEIVLKVQQPLNRYNKKADQTLPFDKQDTKSELLNSGLVIELNSADTKQLMRLKGIGPFYAEKIVKYRDLLGGFISKEQLLEIYCINDSVYQQISNYVKVETSNIKKININKCGISQLNKHPYIKYHVANAIVNYRDQHGKYNKISDIKKTDLVDNNLFDKIAPYLKLEE